MRIYISEDARKKLGEVGKRRNRSPEEHLDDMVSKAHEDDAATDEQDLEDADASDIPKTG